MKHNLLTKHASSRMQQRGISELAIELLFEFGYTMYHRGTEVFFFKRRSLKRLIKSKKCNQQFAEKVKDNHLVLGNGCVGTVGHHFFVSKEIVSCN